MSTRAMLSRSLLLACLLVGQLATTGLSQISDQRVRESLQDGVQFLLSKQRENGSWPDHAYAVAYPTGVTSLCTLALLNAGMTAEDPAIQRALTFLRGEKNLVKTYTRAMQTLVFCAAKSQKDLPQINRNVAWLVGAQRTGVAGPASGSWGYDQNGASEDPSNAQFALLALYEADRAGVRVDEKAWRLALAYWQRTQRADGSFAYAAQNKSSGSMTCAGIGSMIIASGHVANLDATVTDQGQVQCCGATPEANSEGIESALNWLGKNFAVTRNPNQGDMYFYYYLYALERVGRLAGRRFIGDHDWYREGVEVLLDRQDEVSGYWNAEDQLASTAFAILFLSKGRRPVLMAKIKRQPEHDWNHHRHDVAHLSSYVEKRWKQDLTWQVVDLSKATADDLWQSPVLFISGRDALDVAQAEKAALKEYIERGGFVFAENCCNGDGFDRDFRALMRELFPDSELERLPPKHAVWFAEQRVNPKYLWPVGDRELWGIDACCRTGVVYCPQNLSCFWELATPQRQQKKLPAAVAEEMKACMAIGANVVTYATGRELKQKLDDTGYVSIVKKTVPQNRASLYVAKLEHNGGSDDAPTALSNVLAVVGQQTKLPVAVEKRMISPRDETLPDYPIAFMHGRNAFHWSKKERAAIRRFLDNGGVLFADAICASDKFAQAFRKEMQAIYAIRDRPLRQIPPDHAMFTTEYHGHDVRVVSHRNPRGRARGDDPLSIRTEKKAPSFEGVEVDGRFVVIFSPLDMSCALENRPSLECQGYTREDAAKLATNIVLYAMQQ